MMFALDVGSFTTSARDIAGGTILLLFLFGPAAAGFTYCVSFLFKSPSACNTFVIVLNFFVGMAGPLITFILRIIGNLNENYDEDSNSTDYTLIAQIIEWILRIFPSFCLSKGLFFSINIETLSDLSGDPNMTVWSKEVMLYEVIILGIQSVAYICLAVVIDTLSSRPRTAQLWESLIKCSFLSCKKSSAENSKFLAEIDDDVAKETKRVKDGDASDDTIVLHDLTKVFPDGKVAVDHISLGIPEGQCFGLLGINGAGKTTTMGMLTAEFPPTNGDAKLAGYSVTNNPEETRQRIGYCPQFDAHFMNMTGREHVKLYAAIKGVPKQFIDESVSKKLREVGLSEQDSDRLSSNYSGGMKRKLSVCCATIGDPEVNTNSKHFYSYFQFIHHNFCRPRLYFSMNHQLVWTQLHAVICGKLYPIWYHKML